VLGLAADDRLKNFKKLRVFEVGFDDIASVAGKLTEGVKSSFPLDRSTLIL
jgi:hypothetical protein